MTIKDAIKQIENVRSICGPDSTAKVAYEMAIAALRAQEQTEKQPCFIVIHKNYAEGVDAYAFQTEDKALASIRQDARTMMAELEQQGYSPRCVGCAATEISVYVPDSDIYYDWACIPSHVE